ncbi:C39 family peptidase [Chungangia koreensis]|uniref:C39 family peptidase n=1 Tax=Chungangia koreensis TaxID=752657 RepID=A0ABV8X7K6_9LACT
MKVLLEVEGQSQYSEQIDERYRNSACGPVTASILMKHHGQERLSANELYKLLHTTKIGLFKRHFIKNMRRILGNEWIVEETLIEGVKKELCAGRPVAAKFDRYFSFRWMSTFEFSYHWVPVIGFEETEYDLCLYIHDNGGRNRSSRIRKISYSKNAAILSFVRISPK